MFKRRHKENNLYFQLESSSQLHNELKMIINLHYNHADYKSLKKLYKTTKRIFSGKFPGYRRCNTEYHNFQHTEQVLLAAVRIIDGCLISGKEISSFYCKRILLAALFHDIGFIQEDWDNEGTGAKYTSTVVERSIHFIRKNAKRLGIGPEDLLSVCRIMESVNIRNDFNSIDFTSPEEKLCGMILGTADLLGQMSCRVYLEKLLFLFREFREGGVEGYDTAFDIIKKTIGFYEFTKERLVNLFDNIFMDVTEHFKERYGVNKNLYMYAIDKNIQYLMKIIDDDSTNFRHKLRRAV